MKRLRMRYLIVLSPLALLVQPGMLLAADMAAGRALYQQYCSMCHGPQGKGDGPAATAMNPKPRDHTDGRYMNVLSDAHLTAVISAGGAAVQRSPLMPSWQGTLSPCWARSSIPAPQRVPKIYVPGEWRSDGACLLRWV
jgi:mono/diheme cytochrome c family protein